MFEESFLILSYAACDSGVSRNLRAQAKLSCDFEFCRKMW